MAGRALARAALAALGIVSGCGGDDGPAPPTADAGTGTVVVAAIDQWISAQGVTELTTPGAVVRLYAPGTGPLVAIPSEAGRYHGFLNIPYDELLVQTATASALELSATRARTFDIGRYRLGRTVFPAEGMTQLQLVVDGLSPWQPTDGLRLVSGNAHTDAWFETAAFVPPVDGATAADLTAAWGFYWPLLGAQDDVVLYQQQVVPAAAGQPSYVRVTRALDLAGAMMPQNVTTTLGGTMTAPPELSFAHAWRGAAFGALGGEIHPSLVGSPGCQLSVRSQPFGAAHGPFSEAPTDYTTSLLGLFANPVLLEIAVAPADADLALGWANPLATTWTPYVRVQCAWPLAYVIPNATSTFAFATAQLWLPLDQLADGPIEPLVSPPRDLRIDGQDALPGLQLSARPVISWSAPTVGTPTEYIVSWFHMVIVAGIAQPESTAHFHTHGTSLQLPAEFVKTRQRYYALVTAVYEPNSDRTLSLFDESFPRATADVATGLLTTPDQ